MNNNGELSIGTSDQQRVSICSGRRNPFYSSARSAPKALHRTVSAWRSRAKSGWDASSKACHLSRSARRCTEENSLHPSERDAGGLYRTLISKLSAGLLLLTALVLLGSGVGEAQAQLVAAYGFNEGTGTTTANLAGGSNGTLTSTTWSTAGQVGNALSFNGTTSRVNVADSAAIDLTTGMTLEAWVFPTSLTGTRTVIAKERSGGFVYALFASNGASLPAAAIRIGTTTVSVTGPASLPLNAWSHLAATYSGSALILYVNGAQVASQAATGSITVTTLALRIGGNTRVTGQYYAGRIDEVRIYNQALTAGQIQADLATPVDLVPPAITARSPAAGATGVSNTTAVTATFNEAMAAATVNGTTFQLRDAAAALVPAAVTYAATTRIATLTPSAPLASG